MTSLTQTRSNSTTQPLVIGDFSIRQDENGRYCLNDLHKASGNDKKHQPAYFIRNQQTKDLISEILNSANLQSLENSNFQPVKKIEGVKGGTFVVKELVYYYAMWISAKFHLTVIRAYDAMVMQWQMNDRKNISPEQQATLQEIVDRRSNGERKVYAEMWSRHNRHFKIPRYSALLAIHFDDAVTYLEEMKIKAIKQVEEQPKPPLNIHDFVNTQQNEVMSYVWSLRQQIEALGGELTELPFDQDMIVRGFLGHFLNGKRMILNFSDQGIDMSFVEHNSLTIREEEIANIIAHESRIQKNLLPNIIDAAVKRLSK